MSSANLFYGQGNEQVVSTRAAALMLKVSEGRVRQFCQSGRLGQKFAGRFMISIQELQRFAEQNRKPGRPATKS
jgi:hypothetical protein